MKKLLLLITAFTCVMFSCHKVYHPTNPTPDNYRLMSYSKVTTNATLAAPVTENYSFTYDASNRVSQVFYTSNDLTRVANGTADLSITFTYTNDSIYKTATDLKTQSVKERDTFLINTSGQITNAFFPNEIHTFAYYGKLLANEMVGFRDTGTLITANLTYTSNNGDFLYRLFNGQLSVGFEDTGIRPDISPIDTTRDTVLSLPLTVTWTTVGHTGTTTTTTHTGLNSYADQLGGYYENFLIVNAVDANGVAVRPGYFPEGYAAKQFYQIYDYLTNRTGDYLQIESFATYGINIYQQAHMLKSLQSPYFTTTATYTIDGDSKVTYTNVVVRDSVLKTETNMAYKFQYQTYY